MTEQQPRILSVESAHLRFDPSDRMMAALAGFCNDSYHARGLTPKLDSVSSFQLCRLGGNRIQPYPLSYSDYEEQRTPLIRRITQYSMLRLEPLNAHQIPLTSAFRMQTNKRGDMRLFFRIVPSRADRLALASLQDLPFPSNDNSIELYTHIHSLQRVIGREALDSAYANMTTQLETGKSQQKGISNYHAERIPLDSTKRLFVSGARLAQVALPHLVPAPLAVEAG